MLVRIAHLEATRDEYRRQMTGLLGSSSWRVTAPLRALAGFVRLARRRVRRLPERFARRPAPSTSYTAGLFHPDAPEPGGLVTAASPLLARRHPARRDEQPGLLLPRSDARVLVAAHVYYPEVWFDIEDRLARMPEPYDLVVSLVEGRSDMLESEIAQRLPRATVQRVPNLGRDLGPLVELAEAGGFDGYDAVLKVHTKRSPHRIDGDAWRVALLDGVMPSPDGIARILELLRRDDSVGLVVPSGHIDGPESWGSNQPLVEALAARLPLAFDPSTLQFPAGSMYWARPWVLGRLADLRLGPEHFEPEASQVDGSTAHALERFVGVAAQASGLDLVDAADVAPRLHRARRKPSAPAQGARVLSAPVPSDPGERRLVGNRVHRLGQRRPRPSSLRGAPATRGARRARPLRPVRSRGHAAPGGAGHGLRHRRARHAPLLVRRPQAPRHAATQPARATRRSSSRSRSAGRTRTGRGGGTASTPTYSSPRTTARAGRIASTTTSSLRSATSDT